MMAVPVALLWTRPTVIRQERFDKVDITPEMPLWSIGGRPRHALDRIGPAGPYASVLRPGKNRRKRK